MKAAGGRGMGGKYKTVADLQGLHCLRKKG